MSENLLFIHNSARLFYLQFLQVTVLTVKLHKYILYIFNSVLLNDVFVGAVINDDAATTVFATGFVVVHANGAHSARRDWTLNVLHFAALSSGAGDGGAG